MLCPSVQHKRYMYAKHDFFAIQLTVLLAKPLVVHNIYGSLSQHSTTTDCALPNACVTGSTLLITEFETRDWSPFRPCSAGI